jgi:NADH-quinone oxidoreductase subunit M
MLTLLTVLPVAGALLVLALGRNLARTTALVFSFASLALTLILWFRFDPTSAALQFQ